MVVSFLQNCGTTRKNPFEDLRNEYVLSNAKDCLSEKISALAALPNHLAIVNPE